MRGAARPRPCPSDARLVRRLRSTLLHPRCSRRGSMSALSRWAGLRVVSPRCSGLPGACASWTS
eukprot:scaffold1195_cov358-Prasinococcus_capsulatus_cf.AAC.6